MIGVDTNFLIQIALAELPGHQTARSLLAREVELRGERVALVPLVISEFIHAATDPRRFTHPLPPARAVHEARQWWDAVDTIRIHPTDDAMSQFFDWMIRYQLGRQRILDTLLAATLHTAGVRRLFTSNPDDFRIFGVFELLVP